MTQSNQMKFRLCVNVNKFLFRILSSKGKVVKSKRKGGSGGWNLMLTTQQEHGLPGLPGLP